MPVTPADVPPGSSPWRLIGPLELLVLQPTPFCNLDCSYCYLPDRGSTRRMSEPMLNRVFETVFASGLVERGFTVVWHAGEPLVLPPEYYERALDIIARHNRAGAEVAHSFQTNGVLIDRRWCEFILRNHFSVGVSVDGPAFLHDRNRRTRAGGPTHGRVMAGIARLREHGIPFHVIAVLTAESLDYADELYDFFWDNGIFQVGFNIEEIEGPHTGSSLGESGTAERFARFIGRFFDLVTRDKGALRVREFDATLPALLGGAGGGTALTQENAPFAILSVDCEGNFTTYSPEFLGLKDDRYGDFIIGNFNRDSLLSAASGTRFHRLSADIAAGIARCRTECEYFEFCGGGAPVNKFFENGSFATTETMFCKLNRKTLVDVLLNRMADGAHARSVR